jgi:stearoyl-CoA desaturase (delta-9 desaturase)
VSRANKISNLIAVILPPIGVVVAIVLLWNRAVDWIDLGLLAGMYVITAAGVTIGYHRLLTHRSFATYKPIEYGLAVAASLSLQGAVLDWVADHRKHHAHTDAEGDPHSPHVGAGNGLSGLWHAHVGWMFRAHGMAEHSRYAADIADDRGMMAISRAFPWLVAASFLIPAALGGLLHWSIAGALTGAIWGGLVRIFLLHHTTWSINSVCHYLGRRRFATEDHSTNVAWLALPSLGEAWHHNHHAFPRSARHGLRPWEIDLTWAAIWTMEKLGLAWNVIRISEDRQAQRLAA